MHRSSPSPLRWISLVVAGGIALAALVLLFVRPDPAQAGPGSSPLPQDGPPTNAYCLTCHYQPGLTEELPSGELLDANIDPALYGGSVHGQQGIACVQCHTDIQTYPHPEKTGVQDRRDYTISYRESCRTCHADQYDQTLDSIHNEVFLAGNKNAPMCSDCHNPHAQGELTQPDGTMNVDQKNQVSQTCASCHSQIYEEYIGGIHGSSLLEGNPDVPTCVDCHGVHNIPDPETAEFRLSSVNVCADCHTDETRMAQYDLSTAVLDTYIDDFHGKTVVLFEAQETGQFPNTPVCFDCHGVHGIVSVKDPDEGLAVKENLLSTCQRCHPDATSNFPTSWLGHYVPDQQRFPLVYYVTLFYRIFVPTVLGVMAVFVVTDIARRVINRRKGIPTKEGPVAAPDTDGKPEE
ncbi:MAG TPA: cytochrome c3 family protein [Anaerolineaceae bacterium]|nr:cytochrome c3 family protein [Anaerolineaceae bacterium]